MQLYELDFDGVYKEQIWRQLLNKRIKSLRPTWNSGINGFCSPQAEKILTEALITLEPPALTFLGSGNYHYLSYLLLQKIKEPFSLVLFDYHSDMQDSLCADLLSCGNWVKFALRYCTNLKQVFIVGISEGYSANIQTIAKKEVFVFSEKRLVDNNWLIDFENLAQYPLYISIDKDVFDISLVHTNWDHGSMDYATIDAFFRFISSRYDIVGADICGEYPVDYADAHFRECQLMNGEMNRYLLQALDNHQNYRAKKIC